MFFPWSQPFRLSNELHVCLVSLLWFRSRCFCQEMGEKKVKLQNPDLVKRKSTELEIAYLKTSKLKYLLLLWGLHILVEWKWPYRAVRNFLGQSLNKDGSEGCKKKPQSLCWAPCCCSGWKISCSQAVVLKDISLLNVTLNVFLWTKDANNKPQSPSVCFLGRPRSSEMGSTSFWGTSFILHRVFVCCPLEVVCICVHCCRGTPLVLKFWWCAFTAVF